MSFASPLLLWLLVPLVLLALLRSVWGGRQPRLAIAELAAVEAAATATWRTRTRWVPSALRWAAIAVLIVVIARPREGAAVALIPQEGIDVVAAVDVSSSMDTFMSNPGLTRIDAAKMVLSEFVRNLEGDRVGLVTFQSAALTVSPLTHDYTALQVRINSLSGGLLADGTAIGLGIAESVLLLEHSPAKSRVIVLLTDGRNNRGAITPARAAQIAEALDIRVYAIGFIGDAGGFSEGANARTLSLLAESTGGRYFDARTPEELSAAYRTIGQLERSLVGERRFTSFNEFGPWLAGLAVALLALAAISQAAVWRRYP
jgi:Ca-activated chloride channel family protein